MTSSYPVPDPALPEQRREIESLAGLLGYLNTTAALTAYLVRIHLECTCSHLTHGEAEQIIRLMTRDLRRKPSPWHTLSRYPQ